MVCVGGKKQLTLQVGNGQQGTASQGSPCLSDCITEVVGKEGVLGTLVAIWIPAECVHH